ncbi:DNA primase large subunit PriL [Salinigranum halophilum]|uniref:DNA primase large subunit PriL n=1 Tax=Salinigranum halophilum TaxID=2565931 RepID=UPI0010A7F828|nr:DNA primase large subunit PriL [Salinigranum halophilum]
MSREVRHARYPFFSAAREAVRAADLSLFGLVDRDAPAVERARERVERALTAGTTAPEEPDRWDPTDDLLSYPIARILVSLLDDGTAVKKYAAAEAATAADRFEADFGSEDDGLRSVERVGVTREEVLDEFGIDAEPELESERRRASRGRGWYRVALETYLTYSDPDWGDDWRLVNREVAAGRVRIEQAELDRLVEEAVRRRVAEGLPFDVRERNPDLADALEPTLASVRQLLTAGHAPTSGVGVVEPSLFPPCVKALLERSRGGERLSPESRFALTAFLVAIGLDGETIASVAGVDEEAATTQVEFLRDREGVQYPSPSCATMQAYGDCVNRDDRCERITHPLSYYKTAIEANDAGAASPVETAEASDER